MRYSVDSRKEKYSTSHRFCSFGQKRGGKCRKNLNILPQKLEQIL